MIFTCLPKVKKEYEFYLISMNQEISNLILSPP